MADENDDDEVKLPGLPPNTKNYMTPACYRRLLDEREHLVNVERPEVVNVVSWAASVATIESTLGLKACFLLSSVLFGLGIQVGIQRGGWTKTS